MAIKTLRTVQDAETRMITSFEVTFKKIRMAATAVSAVAPLTSGRTATQGADISTNGTTSGTPGASLGGGISGTQ